MTRYLLLSSILFLLIFSASKLNSDIEVKGTFKPSGPPTEGPVRLNAGTGCIIELKQPYTIAGTLSGSLEIDYRILVKGPCGAPMGTYDETWIAYGSFTGNIDGNSKSGKFTYTANVKAGGEVFGTIIFGQGINGELKVEGKFSDGILSYKGWITKP
ncbi:MAG: hypothetical protein HND52_16620 [Ignavibacteriae bacterium]|nr:hypothetical protein [Ignavibacteriota bacterium]NOG99583.1 hypothetical protein [Ignavibacteriota bacterium]